LCRGRGVRARHPHRGAGPGGPQRVRHLLYALPAGAGAGRPPGAVRVPDDAVPHHRDGRGQRLPLRRRLRRRRGPQPGRRRHRPVGGLGADVAVGEGQPLGTPLAFGGPYVGLFAVKQAPYVRRWLPGRLVGEGEDSEGRKAYVLTLSTREQHIRRAGASSNVCTNQTLIAVTTAIHLAWLGPQGLRELALRCARGARYTREALLRI